MATTLRLGGILMLALAACNTAPPQAWLRYQPNGQHPWVAGPDGRWLARMHGVDVSLELNRTETRVQVTVTNTTNAAIEVRMGAEASSPKGAIGQCLLRAIDGPQGVGGSDWVGYVALQPVAVDAGWRGTFCLDHPLGREIVLGQSFVLTVEARAGATGPVERRSMPLIATNAGTMPRDRR
ncbi:MAG: hypothetical protein WBO45_01530 [Planctomycetota bacterium]